MYKPDKDLMNQTSAMYLDRSSPELLYMRWAGQKAHKQQIVLSLIGPSLYRYYIFVITSISVIYWQ